MRNRGEHGKTSDLKLVLLAVAVSGLYKYLKIVNITSSFLDNHL